MVLSLLLFLLLSISFVSAVITNSAYLTDVHISTQPRNVGVSARLWRPYGLHSGGFQSEILEYELLIPLDALSSSPLGIQFNVTFNVDTGNTGWVLKDVNQPPPSGVVDGLPMTSIDITNQQYSFIVNPFIGDSIIYIVLEDTSSNTMPPYIFHLRYTPNTQCAAPKTMQLNGLTPHSAAFYPLDRTLYFASTNQLFASNWSLPVPEVQTLSISTLLSKISGLVLDPTNSSIFLLDLPIDGHASIVQVSMNNPSVSSVLITDTTVTTRVSSLVLYAGWFLYAADPVSNVPTIQMVQQTSPTTVFTLSFSNSFVQRSVYAMTVTTGFLFALDRINDGSSTMRLFSVVLDSCFNVQSCPASIVDVGGIGYAWSARSLTHMSLHYDTVLSRILVTNGNSVLSVPVLDASLTSTPLSYVMKSFGKTFVATSAITSDPSRQEIFIADATQQQWIKMSLCDDPSLHILQFSGGELEPPFSSLIFNYTLHVPIQMSTVQFTATLGAGQNPLNVGAVQYIVDGAGLVSPSTGGAKWINSVNQKSLPILTSANTILIRSVSESGLAEKWYRIQLHGLPNQCQRERQLGAIGVNMTSAIGVAVDGNRTAYVIDVPIGGGGRVLALPVVNGSFNPYPLVIPLISNATSLVLDSISRTLYVSDQRAGGLSRIIGVPIDTPQYSFIVLAGGSDITSNYSNIQALTLDSVASALYFTSPTGLSSAPVWKISVRSVHTEKDAHLTLYLHICSLVLIMYVAYCAHFCCDFSYPIHTPLYRW
jgi:hypothetical protein